MPTSSSLHEIQPDMEQIPPAQQQQEREQEQELGGLQQQLLQRQQRIAQLRVKRLSMSTIVDTSSSSFSPTSSSTARYSSSSSSSRTASFSLPTSPITGYTASSLGSISFLENRPTSNSSSSGSGSNSNNSVFRRHSRRTSSSMSSNPAFPAVPGSSVTPVPARCQQQQQKQKWSTKHQVSQSSELDCPPQLLPFPSRPNSFASSYQPVILSRKNSQRSSQQQQQRQLDQQGPLSMITHHSNDSNSANRYEKESNAAFDRICSLLTHLITDASTAVSTSENKDADGGGLSVIIPHYLPIVCSESENSDNDEVQEQQQQEALDPRGQGGAMDPPINHDDYGGLDGRNLIYDEEHHQIPESPRDQIRRRIDDSRKKRWARTRSGSYITSPSKRTSLFLELQNLQMEEQPMGEQHSTTPVLNHHHRHLDSGFESLGKLRQLQDFGPMDHGALSPVFGSFSAGRTLDSLVTTTTTTTTTTTAGGFSPATPSRSLDFELFDSELGSPITLTPRRRASFPPRRSDRVQLQRAEELQRVIQRVDAELDRTVETIDDLTRDLVAVATHQNWMKTHLERTLGLYSPLSLADFIEKDDATFQAEAVEGAGAGAGVATPMSSTIPRDRLEQMEDIIGATKALLSSKEFANYYQVLERVRVIEEDEYDDYERDGDDGDVFGGRSDIGTKHHQQQQQQRLSGSSYTLANNSFRHSASSTLSLETRFGSYADFKDGALLTSNSNRPSIEWSDRIGAPYNNNSLSLSQDRIHPLVAAPAFLDLQEQQEPASPLMSTLVKSLELIAEQPAKQETNKQEQRATAFDALLHQTALGNENNLSTDAALAIDKLILACTHLALLLFWTLALFLGVVITDGSILENAGRQLISSVEILQSHFTVPKDVQDDKEDMDNILDDDMPSFSAALQEQEQEQGPAPTPKSTRPSHPSSTRRRRTRPSSQQRHQHRHHLLRRRLSSFLPQINAPTEGGSSFTSTLGVDRFYNSPFLASSRYQVDISSKEPKAIQLGPSPGPSTDVPSASTAASAATMSSSPVTAPVPPASLSSSCSSTTGLQDQDSLSSSISTASSSATLLDWLDSTTTIHSVVNGQKKKEIQAFTNIDTNTINNNNNDGRLAYESHH
ncbi:MAG: hypothetical protein J3R72DRAFT_435126 [Linnemannia gamsii]|nr:MAG: hypothetical protein J3R72DRAFT_435126 [Linnemannia gamsii]